VGALRVELRLVVAPRLAANLHLVGNDVDRAAAVDDAQVRRGLVVDAAEANLEQILASFGRLMRSQGAPT